MATQAVDIIEYSEAHPEGLKIGEIIVETSPATLTKADFNKHGWAQVGMVRHQQILEACAAREGAADIDVMVRAVYRQYLSALQFEKADAVALATILVNATIMQQSEADLYLGNWPQI